MNIFMKFCLIFLILLKLTISISAKKVDLLSLKPQDIDKYWKEFKTKHNRNHTSQNEAKRRKIFEANLKKVNELNEQYNNGKILYTSGITGFSDFTPDEFLAYVKKGGLANTTRPTNINNFDFEITINITSKLKSLPLTVDWRTKGYVNPIQYQGNCGSCWAFSVASSIEGQYFKKYNKLIKLSEQNLVDCAYQKDGCNGGFTTTAFDFIKQNNGLSLLENYPYTSGGTQTWNGFCRNVVKTAKINGYEIVSNGYPNVVGVTKSLAEIGPLSAALYASENCMHYTGGIFNDPTCNNIGTFVNHAVTLVGYGSENGVDYYILRNSWGDWWGESGYMKIPRNLCNIASFVSYPIIDSNEPTSPSSQTKTTVKTTLKPSSSSTTTRRRVTTTTRRRVTTTTTTTSSNTIGAFTYYISINQLGLDKIDLSLFSDYPLSQIVLINLDGNRIQQIDSGTFVKLNNLNDLSLNDNSISSLQNGWTNGLKNLKKLSLANNELSSLASNSFKGLDNLEELNLSGNNFKFVDRSNLPFNNLNRLKFLDLSNNNLASSISSNSFRNLNNLQELVLSSSNIDSFSSDAFGLSSCAGKTSKTTIYIDNNPVVFNSALIRDNQCFIFSF